MYGAKGLPPPHKNRIYVSNINEQVSENDIADIFSAFGEIDRVAMPVRY